MKKIIFILIMFSSGILKSQEYVIDSLIRDYPIYSKPIQIQLIPFGGEVSEFNGEIRGILSLKFHLLNRISHTASMGSVYVGRPEYKNEKVRSIAAPKILSYKNINASWYFFNKIGNKDIRWCIESESTYNLSTRSNTRSCSRTIQVPSKRSRSLGLRAGITQLESYEVVGNSFVGTNKKNSNEVIDFYNVYKSGSTFQNRSFYSIGMSYRTLRNSRMWLSLPNKGQSIKIKRRLIFDLYFDKLINKNLSFNDMTSIVDQKEWTAAPVGAKLYKYGWLAGFAFDTPDQGLLIKIEIISRPHQSDIDQMMFNFVVGYTLGFKANYLTRDRIN